MLSSLLILASIAAASAPYGVLLLAHGGNEDWNKTVMDLRRSLPGRPVEVAFGMADPKTIQEAVDALERQKAAKIVAIPLFINSSSEVMDQTRYVLGIEAKPSEVMRQAAARMPHGHHGHHMFSMERVKSALPLSLTPALDDHPAVARVLLERAKALSRDPQRESVVLVGHGPVDEKALRAWERALRSLAESVRAQGGFRSVKFGTLRDDSPPAVKAKAEKELRTLVEEGRRSGEVIVIPYLIARGGIEQKVAKALKGLRYKWDARTLLPHESIAHWLAETAALGAKKEDMRRFR